MALAILVLAGSSAGCLSVAEGEIGRYPLVRGWLGIGLLEPLDLHRIGEAFLEKYPVGTAIADVDRSMPHGLGIDIYPELGFASVRESEAGLIVVVQLTLDVQLDAENRVESVDVTMIGASF